MAGIAVAHAIIVCRRRIAAGISGNGIGHAFDVLEDVAKENVPLLPVSLLMVDRWDNIAALKNYSGRLDIFGALNDQVIPVHHARHLAASSPAAVYHEFPGDHGWADSREVNLSKL